MGQKIQNVCGSKPDYTFFFSKETLPFTNKNIQLTHWVVTYFFFMGAVSVIFFGKQSVHCEFSMTNQCKLNLQ